MKLVLLLAEDRVLASFGPSSTLFAEGVHGSVEFPGNLRDGVECDWKCVGNKSQGMRLAVA
jgi:hypothetical protein